MKKISLSLLLLTLQPINAHTNKTHLTIRSHGHNSALFHSVWRKSVNSRNFSGGIAAFTPFISLSDNKEKLAKYFMFNNKASLGIGRNTDIDNRHLKFDETSQDRLTGTVKFSPSVETYGLRIDYHQELKKLLQNLFLEATAPVVHTVTDAGLRVEDSLPSLANNKTIYKYFMGQEMLTKSGFILQEPLTYGKIKKDQHKTGVADINFTLGYHIINNNNLLLNLKANLNIPTSASPRTDFLFEPILGTGGHFGIGATVDGFYNLNENLSFIYDLSYRYLISDTQKRILGLKDRSGTKLNWGQYLLLGKINNPLVLPAANALRQFVEVNAGSQVEALLMLSGKLGNFIAEAGYNLWYKEREKVKRRAFWDEDGYGFVSSDYKDSLTTFVTAPTNNFTTAFTNLSNTIGTMSTSGSSASTQGTILASQLDTDVCESPSAFTNKLFFAMGHEWTNKNTMYILGSGISYEFSSSDSAIKNLTLWLKGAISF